VENVKIDDNILEVKGLKTYFYTEDGVVKAVDGVDFDVKRGEIIAIVGESGCGKSVTSFSIMQLVGIPGKVVDGSVLFNGQDLLDLPESEMRLMRGDRLSMIFQQPTSALIRCFAWVIRSLRYWKFTGEWTSRKDGHVRLSCCVQ
jgi:ABC-type dipeptide/oligopeptide/nickel transport system ATPase component